ncbi:MAG: L,D-transpeptidase [Mogibacterium sp.]|nr:L,D-transpeptidase [Mogibacterium sp.]
MRKRIAAIFLIMTLFVTMSSFEMFAESGEEQPENSNDQIVLEEGEGQVEETVEEVTEPEETPAEEEPAAAEEEEPAPAEDAEAPAEDAAPAEAEGSAETEAEAMLAAPRAVPSVTELVNLAAGTATQNAIPLTWAFKPDESLAAGETITIAYEGKEIPGITGTSYTVADLAAGTSYTFTFKIGDRVVGTVSAATLPGPVPGFRKVSSYKTVILKWNQVPGAARYFIKVNGQDYGNTTGLTLTHKVGTEKDIINLYNKSSGSKFSGNIDGKDRFTYTITAKDSNGKVLAESTTTGDIVKTLYYKLKFKAGASLTSHSGGKVTINVKKGAIVYARGFSDGKYIFDYKCKDGKIRTYHTMKIRVKPTLSKHITAIKNKRGENTQPPYTIEEAEQYARDRGIKKATTNYMIWVNLFSQKEYVFQKKSGKWRIVTANEYGLKNKQMAMLPVSTGKASMPTATGSTKINRKLNSQHGTPLWNVTKFFSIHGVQKKWPKPGWPESGACARNQSKNAVWIYKKIPKYTRVFVH